MLVPSRSPHSAGQGRADALARRDEVRLEAPVAGRPAAREEADAVGVRPVTVGRADRDHPVGIARVRDAECCVALVRAVLGLEVLVAAVARGRHHDDAALDEPLAFDADRRPAAGEVAHVMRDRQAQVGAVDRDVACRSFR